MAEIRAGASARTVSTGTLDAFVPGMKRRVGLTVGLWALGAVLVFPRLRRPPLRDKVVVIAGGSRGLGLVLARQLARQGARLVLLGRDPGSLERARRNVAQHVLPATEGGRELPERTAARTPLVIPCDVTDRQQVENAIERALAAHGRIDVLVSTAGDIEVAPFDAMDLSDFERAMATNFWGPLYLIRAVLPSMRAQGGGRIVNVSSIGGLVSIPHLLPYSASKFALTGLSSGLRAELAKDGIKVTTICPGLMRTGSPGHALFKGDRDAEFAWFDVADSLPLLSMSAERAARRIIRALQRGEARVVLSLPAKITALAWALSPGVTSAALSLANRLLPRATADGPARPVDERSSRRPPSWLTALGDRAARRNNQAAEP